MISFHQASLKSFLVVTSFRLAFALGFIAPSLLLLTGCPQRDNSALVLLCPSGKVTDTITPALKQFQSENPTLKVRLISCPPKDYYTKALSLFAARQRVDVVWLGQGFGMFASRGTLLPLNKLMEEEAGNGKKATARNAFIDSALSLYTYSDQLYGLPYGLDLEVLAINEDLFHQADIPIPDDLWTYEDFLNIARSIAGQTALSKHRIFALGMSEIPPGFIGLSLVSQDGNHFSFTGAKALNWLQTNIDLRASGALLPTATEGQFDRLEEFLSNRIAIMRIFTWEIRDLKERAKFQWRLLPQPKNTDNSQYAWASSSGFSIVKNSPDPEKAWKLLKCLIAPEMQVRFSETSVPALKSLWEQYADNLDERERAIIHILPTIVPEPRIRTAEKVASEWRYWQDKAMEGQMTPEQALEIASRRIDQILQKP